jgi:FtsP/CotA-like multicopper oxidase with cupredoxin domain
MWFHDHGNDTTAYNVAHGLAGFSLFTDRLEESWIANGQLPDVDLRSPSTNGKLGNLTLDAKGATQQGQYDIPMAFTDQALNPDGTLFWDAFDHDGRIGDLFTVNGVTQPFLNVEPRKYRFRLLGASLARVYMLRLSSGDTMTQIGYDSWLLPKPVTVSEIKLGPAKRADVIIDFSKLAGKTIYLQNIMQQSTGRKPDGVDAKKPTNIVQFKVGTKANFAQYPEFTLPTTLRPHATLLEKDATVTRYFDFNRSNGAWQINQQFYSAVRCDADIKKGALEKWVLRNGSGGWWHPIHIHVEAHQVLRINGATPPEIQKYKSDNSMLEDNTTVELLMKFRTFDGPFVFHCHNNQHEDMRMMKQFEICNPNPDGSMTPCLNGQWFSVPEKMCGVPTSFIKANPGLFS